MVRAEDAALDMEVGVVTQEGVANISGWRSGEGVLVFSREIGPMAGGRVCQFLIACDMTGEKEFVHVIMEAEKSPRSPVRKPET